MPKATVTSSVVATDKVAVNVKEEPASSAIEVFEVAKVTIGVASASARTVIVTD